MTDYDLPAYRCTECGEQPALIADNTTGGGGIGVGCACTQENGKPFVSVNSTKPFAMLLPGTWVWDDG